MTDERDLLSNIIAFNVQRVDLTTGDVVNYGTITSDVFDESFYVDIKSSTGLKSGRKYKYDVTPMLRDSETMFNNIKTVKIDPTTKKQYNFSPSTSIHPLSLKTGTITTDKSRSLRHGLDEMSYGRFGVMKAIPTIMNLAVSKFNSVKNLVTWNVQKNESRIDHFIVFKDIAGIREVIGKVHSTQLLGSFTFFHTVTSRDYGPIKYVIIPVYDGYTHGSEYVTETVFFELDDVEAIANPALKYEQNFSVSF
jgi:hypothetical protein